MKTCHTVGMVVDARSIPTVSPAASNTTLGLASLCSVLCVALTGVQWASRSSKRTPRSGERRKRKSLCPRPLDSSLAQEPGALSSLVLNLPWLDRNPAMIGEVSSALLASASWFTRPSISASSALTSPSVDSVSEPSTTISMISY